MKARADKLDLKIRALHPANPVYMAWTNRDQHSTMFASVIPTEQYNLTNEELWSAASTSLGIPNPVCIPHIGTRRCLSHRSRSRRCRRRGLSHYHRYRRTPNQCS